MDDSSCGLVLTGCRTRVEPSHRVAYETPYMASHHFHCPTGHAFDSSKPRGAHQLVVSAGKVDVKWARCLTRSRDNNGLRNHSFDAPPSAEQIVSGGLRGLRTGSPGVHYRRLTGRTDLFLPPSDAQDHRAAIQGINRSLLTGKSSPLTWLQLSSRTQV